MTIFSELGPVIGALVILLVLLALVAVSGVIRYIANDRLAVIEKLWSPSGSIKSGIIALGGEAGFQGAALGFYS